MLAQDKRSSSGARTKSQRVDFRILVDGDMIGEKCVAKPAVAKQRANPLLKILGSPVFTYGSTDEERCLGKGSKKITFLVVFYY